MKVLVINCGSSTIKYQLIDMAKDEVIAKGRCDKIGYEAEKQLIEYGIDIIPDEFGEKETLRKAVQMIKYRDKVLDLVLRLESG